MVYRQFKMNAMILVIGAGGFMMMCCCAIVALVLMSGTGATTQEVVTDIGQVSEEVKEEIPTVQEFTPPGCVTFTEHADGGGKQFQYCLDGRDYFEIKNMKNYKHNDLISGVGVGEGVGMTIFVDANQKGESHEIHGPAFENLADTWKNDKASSFKMWKR
jgi:hypothetical protein